MALTRGPGSLGQATSSYAMSSLRASMFRFLLLCLAVLAGCRECMALWRVRLMGQALRR